MFSQEYYHQLRGCSPLKASGRHILEHKSNEGIKIHEVLLNNSKTWSINR